MRFFRRSLITLGVAATLPTVVFVAVGAFYFLRAERARVETETLGRSEIATLLVDGRLRRDVAALGVLTSSVDLAKGNFHEFYSRVQRVMKANPAWRSIVLIDARSEQEMFDLRRPFGPPVPVAETHAESLQQIRQRMAPVVGSVTPPPEALAWVYSPVVTDGQVRYVLGAAILPQVFQDLLVAVAEPGTTAAIVDSDGRFVARTLNFETRVGTPATSFVRAAIQGGERGFYRGTTFEGLKNFTAFHTSPWSDWSAHLAVASGAIDAPTRWSFVAAGLAALGALVLGGTLILLVLRDMAERRRAEETLRQSQKMEAVGQLTGGIAHDFNNLLTAVIGNLDMIRSRVQTDERLRRMADNALEASRRGAKLASQLLAFSRSQRMSVGPVDLQKLFNGISGLIAQSVGPAVEVRMELDPDAQMVMSDANQLELALLNLAVNARDAMPKGGKLVVTARRVQGVDKHLPKGDYVRLSVTDTGVGMTDQVRARAIEPFFTTKPVGQGTGLGLSQVYAVTRESGGSFEIESEPNQGTTIHLTLPRAVVESAAPAAPPAAELAKPQPEATGSASILVVDDDRLVRRFIHESLRSLGYEVRAAEDGHDALSIMESQRFDLLLADFAMPRMTGAELAKAAQLKQPGLPVLIVSGYADSAAVEAALGSARQLRKPFNMAELGAAVAEILRARVSRA
ncbi:response regulator [Steroidobacter sp. S1-65]|uniref:histidine kinase n=1 Tax=Steroidobacter gossypii TaxID=2805490 RepID=A0ABS1WST1_9GAMM|nr:response regulator [Steroidobacter gossypii]MBM0104036.1 response regulator [Steroidobacter gossypii]